MSNYSYGEIKMQIFEWSQKDILRYLKEQDKMEIPKNNDDALIIDLTFDNCLAQVIVSNPTFAPYQFVSFEAMTLDSDKSQETGIPELIYFFYDTDKMSEKDVIKELEVAIIYCSDYIPNMLKKTYFNRQGVFSLSYEEICRAVHPNDIKKVKEDILNNKLMCVNTYAQYLVVSNNVLTFRILPKYFDVM